jgi:mannose-6-phosphate isomerase
MNKNKRPWGNFITFALNQKCTVKLLIVKPYQKLSLQKHKKRDELWYFLDDGFIELKNIKKKIKSGKSVFIKKNHSHRLYAKENIVRVLEVSFGTFDEKDEIRIADHYGRS